jgi:hypothetical protein
MPKIFKYVIIIPCICKKSNSAFSPDKDGFGMLWQRERPMKLTGEEMRMLDGSEGKLKQKAMEYIVRYGEVLGAEKLCRITKAHLFAGAHQYLKSMGGSAAENIAVMHFCSTGPLRMDCTACYAQTDSGPLDPAQWEKLGATEEEALLNKEYLDVYLNAGVHLVGSCVPYMLGFIPLMGEHYVSTESHAIVFMNSLWGACANADGIEASFCSAVCGRTPCWGNHVKEDRKANVVCKVECRLETINDWDLFGFALGRKLPAPSIPVLDGIQIRPDFERLRSAFSSLATTAGTELCHIAGLTPEAPTVELALGGEKPMETLNLTDSDIAESRDFLSAREKGEVRFVSLGCPHYSIEQIGRVAAFLENNPVHPEVELQVWTAAAIRGIADDCGYTEAIEKSGGKLLCGSCPILTDKWPKDGSGLAFDSAKQANYMKPRTELDIYYGSIGKCLEAAHKGMWEV